MASHCLCSSLSLSLSLSLIRLFSLALASSSMSGGVIFSHCFIAMFYCQRLASFIDRMCHQKMVYLRFVMQLQ